MNGLLNLYIPKMSDFRPKDIFFESFLTIGYLITSLTDPLQINRDNWNGQKSDLRYFQDT